ncbi:MAG TPA: RNA polymerase sigma factor [Thermoanaerobaculia bacterium]|nr:RNA polymerase sigma factor [Thermoanaerobaculia bacterium]
MSFPLAIRDMTIPASRDAEGALSVMGEDEFRLFYERTARPLWAYLSRITGDRQQADDLLQEAYYRFYRAGKRHESETHRRNSLFQIATNLTRDLARRASRYQDVPLENEDDTPSAIPDRDAPVPETRAAMRTDLQRAMQQLEPMQREILWLAYGQGASHQEIAEILGLRAISIRTLLFRARKKLAAILTGGTR